MNNNFNLDSMLSTIATGAKTIETLQATGLDWQVNKVQLYTPDGTPVDSAWANQRADNGAILGVMSEQYAVFQNEELAELCEAIAGEFGYTIHKGGALNGGKKVYLQLSAGSVTGIGDNNDRVEKYVTALNSFDGSSSVCFGSLGYTISCQNTFYRAARDKAMSRVRHTSSMRDRIEAAKHQILGIIKADESLYDTFFKMANAQMTPEIIRNVVQQLTDVDITKSATTIKADHSARKFNIASDLLDSIRRETAYKGGSLWGLMSGVTHYTTHKASAPNRENGRIEAKMTGNAGSMDAQAFDILAKIVA